MNAVILLPLYLQSVERLLEEKPRNTRKLVRRTPLSKRITKRVAMEAMETRPISPAGFYSINNGNQTKVVFMPDCNTPGFQEPKKIFIEQLQSV